MPDFDRLTRMANMVEREVERGYYDFDLSGWGCGTTACAVGLAIATKEFEDEGFHRDVGSLLIIFCPTYRDESGWDAIRVFFGIEMKTALHFFGIDEFFVGSGPDAAKEVVRRIRAFVAEHQPKPEPIKIETKVLEPA